MLKKKYLVLSFALAYTIVLLYLTLGNPVELDMPIKFEFQDKVYHFIAYLGFACIWSYFSVISKFEKGILKAFRATLIFGVILEIIQEWINPMRTFDILDLVANCFGVILGTIIVAYYFRTMKLKY